MNDNDNDTTLIAGNKDTPPLAGELPPIADHERGRPTTAPRVIHSAGDTQASGADGDPGKMRAADADRDRVVERLNIAYSEGGCPRTSTTAAWRTPCPRAPTPTWTSS